MGGYNNVIKVNCNDLEVFKALEMDTVTLESLAQEYGTRIPDPFTTSPTDSCDTE